MKYLTTSEAIGRFLEYDESSPSGLRWRVSRGPRKAGDVAGCLHTTSTGYQFWRVKLHNRLRQAHHIVWVLVKETPIKDHMEIDHKNGDATDNRIANLREVEPAVNRRNRGLAVNNTSGITGVITDSKYPAYHAIWRDLKGHQRSKTFSVAAHGDKAKQLATTWRKQKLHELNAAGAGYTKRHIHATGEQL